MTRRRTASRETRAAEDLWHAMPAEEVALRHGTDANLGLSLVEARRRFDDWGPNQLPEERGPRWYSLLWRQFAQFLILVLVVAAAISLSLGERLDATAIFGIIIVNGLLGFAQEYRAERALASLRMLSAPRATVLREGQFVGVPAADVVPGDIIRLMDGDIVPADARLLDVAALRLNEALLTGESVPVDKQVALVPPETELAERACMVYQGSLVVKGRGLGVVVATGERTEMGRIAASMRVRAPRSTPLESRLAGLGRLLVYGAALLCALVFILGLARGIKVSEMILTSASLAVAAIPEGLPAATTIVLAIAVQRMVRRHVIVRRLAAVDTLGSVSVICVDKTGTLTENRMDARELWYDGRRRSTDEAGRGALGGDATLGRLLLAAMLCNDASLEGAGGGQAIGDPTELALLEIAQRFGIDVKEARARAPRMAELPFDAERSRMTVVCQTEEGTMAFTKGAPEVIIPLAAAVLWEGEEQELDDGARQDVLQAATSMARDGMRVLAFAQRRLPSESEHGELEEGLVITGLVGLADPLRPEARGSIDEAQRAGIRTVMLTGDHPSTARAIAAQLDLPVDTLMLGRQVEELTDADLDRVVAETRVFARVSSKHKLRLIESFRRLGHIIAMTGDGVNDAPALGAADVGVAMGKGGTDVARDASDIILVDNSLRSIVAAIEDGRIIYDNIGKFVHYLVTCNLAELGVVFLVLAADGTTPLVPLQILWVNLLTDSFPALALGLEPGEPGIMERRPRPPESGILTLASLLPIIGIGSLVAIPALAAYAWGRSTGDVELARELTFATLIGAHLVATFNFRSPTRSVLQLEQNRWMLAAIALSGALLVAVIYVPWLQEPFRTDPFSLQQWLGIAALSLIPLVVVEAIKLFRITTRIDAHQSLRTKGPRGES